MKVQISLFYQKSLQTSFKPVLKCKQVDNSFTNIPKRSKFSNGMQHLVFGSQILPQYSWFVIFVIA